MKKCDRCGVIETARKKLKRAVWGHITHYKKPVVVTWFCSKCRIDPLRSAPDPYQDYVPIPAGATLSTYQIEEIRYLAGIGLSPEWIARDVGSSRTTVWRVLSRRMELLPERDVDWPVRYSRFAKRA